MQLISIYQKIYSKLKFLNALDIIKDFEYNNNEEIIDLKKRFAQPTKMRDLKEKREGKTFSLYFLEMKV